MAEIKIILSWIGVVLGGSYYAYSLWINLMNWKGDVLFITAWLGLAVRLYFYIRQKNQALRKEDEESEMRRLKIQQERDRIK